MDARQCLLSGAKVLAPVLRPHGLRFHLRDVGGSSGGNFAWGEFTRFFRGRRLELHFRFSLGLVRYHAAAFNVAHEIYMRELGVWDQCKYPGFSDDPLQAFHGLAHDVLLADDFLKGDAQVLRRAALKERLQIEEAEWDLMAVGDRRTWEEMHGLFYAHRYVDVMARFADLKYPDRLSPAAHQMVQIAREKSGG